MCKGFFDLFRKEKKPSKSSERFTADQVRKYVKITYIIPARQQGKKRVTFSAADVHTGMKLHSRYPLVCSAIDAKKFLEFAKVKLETRTGPKQSSTARWTFRVN
jgi:hypothetical protein